MIQFALADNTGYAQSETTLLSQINHLEFLLYANVSILVNLLNPAVIIFIVTALTALIVSQRTAQIAADEEIANESLPRTQRLYTISYTAGVLLCGVFLTVAYDFIITYWPSLARPLFFWGSIIAVAMLSLSTARRRQRAGMAGTPEMIILYLVWGLGYGWFLPYTVNP